MKNSKQAVILAGGMGARLKGISGNTPKPMMHVLGKPILQHIIEQCAKNDFIDIWLLVSYGADIIERYFGNGSHYGVSIHYYRDDIPMGTAGALFNVLPNLDNFFLVLYGDTYFDVNLNNIWNFHQINNADATLFVHPNDHPYDSDLVELSDDNKITNIHNYPHDKSWKRNLVNAAIYVISRSALVGIEFSSNKRDIAKDLFPIMIKKGNKLCGYISTEYIKDMGTPDRLASVESDISSGKVTKLRCNSKKRALFLDRDGVVNKEVNYLSSPDQFELINGVGNAIHQLNLAGILVVIVTNQPIIARGELNNFGLRIIHNKMDTLLALEKAYIDHIYFCPHHPDQGFKGEVESLKIECKCRKPQPGLLLQAAQEMGISLQDSWLVGDRTADLLAGKCAGVKTILVKTGYAGKDGKYFVKPDFIVDNLSKAVDLVLNDGNN